MSLNPFSKPTPPPSTSEEHQDETALLKASNNTSAAFTGHDDSTFSALFETDDEERALNQAKNAEDPTRRLTSYTSNTIDGKLEEERARLRKEYPMGGVKSSRFITSEILLEAPAEYFSRFDSIVKMGVNWVQTDLSEKAEIIGQSQTNPTDDDLQDQAYRIVQASASEFLNKHSYRSLDRAIVLNFICNEIIGFSRLDPLWRDTNITEILCNGPDDVQVEIKGKLKKVTGVSFRDVQHLMSLIERLYNSIGKTVSQTNPIVDGRLHDFSRMAVVHHSVAPAGPNFSIRRHTEDYITPQRLVDWGAATPEIMTFLGNLIYKKCSVLVLGGTSTGKTTLLSALGGFFREDHRVLTLEDNLELKLPPRKLLAAPMECKPPRADAPGSGVNMRDLVKAALRLRPDAIIVGEVRDSAAYDLCQALNTGHYGLSTIHANNEANGIYRLMSLISQEGLMKGDATLPLIGASFDVMVRLEHFPSDGSRRITSISEVSPMPITDRETGKVFLPTRQIFKFVGDGVDEHLKVKGHWEKVGSLSKERRELRNLDLERDLTWEELKELSES